MDKKRNKTTNGNIQNVQTILIREQRLKSNGMGTAGFVLTLLSLLLAWVPVLGWILWFLGVVFSLIGLFKSPRGLAIVGIVLSLIVLCVYMIFVEVLNQAFAN